MKKTNNPENSPLGKSTRYNKEYNSELLYPIAREKKRNEIGIKYPLPFKGYDMWRAYEFSWLNTNGKPNVAILEFFIPCNSPYIIESKSFKLYLYSFSNTKFNSWNEIENILINDISNCVGKKISLKKIELENGSEKIRLSKLKGISLDNQDLICNEYTVNPNLLISDLNNFVNESVYSNLLKSNCLVTNQPDWGSVQINYSGPKISHESLLKYIISFREHNEFHEQCIERIFVDILTKCQPKKLSVYGFYTRRGGLDINPIRSTDNILIFDDHIRLYRQ